jgi:glycosyltransferase involved in cell wall biosynthesis
MIHYVPIENIEQRYTKLMNGIVYPYVDYIYYPDNITTNKIRKGEFLDIEKTIQFKARQIELISLAFQEGKVKDGDWFLFGDMFFPSIESIKYMAELQNINVKVCGFNYAGRSDEFDFVRKLNKWADYSEKAYHEVCDLIFVGSEFHKKNVTYYFNIPEDKVIVTGYIWSNDKAFQLFNEHLYKEDYVIYPHRICLEKGYNDFIDVAEMNGNKKFIITSSSNKGLVGDLPDNVEYRNNLSKKEYYELMSRAKYYLSTAYQETFGYTLREAILYRCIIAAPNRLCYPEMLPKENLYNNLTEIKSIFTNNNYIENKLIEDMYNNNIENIIKLLK